MLISRTINDALIEIGVINPIDEATPQDHEYGLRTLNRIVDTYNTQNLLITYLEDITYQAPFVNNECETAVPEELVERAWKSAITIGHCQDINEEAPVDIRGAFFRQDSTDYELKPMTFDEWTHLPYKDIVSVPRRYYVQRTNNNNIKIYFDVIPNEGLELHLMAKRPYTGKNSVGNEYLPTDDINWSFGFEKMLMSKLAIELCSSYEITPSPALIGKAMEAENLVKNHNYQPSTLKSDLGLLRVRGRGARNRNRSRF